MNDFQEPNRISLNNDDSIRTLARAIALSQGEFSLTLVRCNYAALQAAMMQKLRQHCSVPIQELVLPPTSETLYTAIKQEIAHTHPAALAVFGLKTVQDIDAVLASTNQVREEFRKAFAFPLVLWINDTILKKLIKQVPDLESWATVIEFEMPPGELNAFLENTANQLFEEILAVGAGPFLSQSCLDLASQDARRMELEAAQADMQQQDEVAPELAASLAFLLGLANADNMQAARTYLEQSLALWPPGVSAERKGCVFYQLGLWWRTDAVQNRARYEASCGEAIAAYQAAIAAFETVDRPDLVAKFINYLGEAQQRLKQWKPLEPLARHSLALNQASENHFRQAEASGLLAEALLGRGAWNEAQQEAQQALQQLETAIAGASNDPAVPQGYIDWHKSFRQGWYLYSLGRSQWNLNQPAEAIQTLEQAREQTRVDYDADLYIRILRTLRKYYFEQKDYLQAFEMRLQYRSIEQQYGFRAFIGAGRLQPQKAVINPALVSVKSQTQNKVSQEIQASGRQNSVQELVNRISRPDQKLTILHGQSGVGKSSIVQAGLIPSLGPLTFDTRQVITILQQVYTNWTETLGQEMLRSLRSLESLTLPDAVASSPAILEQLRKSVEQNLIVVLIFDQFEEFFFVHREPAQRKAFYSFLRESLNIPYVKVILSLREDYLHYLLECNDRLIRLDVINNNILDKTVLFHLGNFKPPAAKAVINSLTQNTPAPLEEPLIDAVVTDLSQELGEVRPIELQVVGAQLQTEQITTLAQYREHGPKDALVSRFLDEVTHDCGPENEEIARLVLYLLTDENNTRPLKTRKDIELELNVPEKLDLILTILVKSGLVFRIPASPEDRYQLVHDYLVIFVRQTQSAQLLAELENEREQRQLTEAKLNEARERQLRTAQRATVTLGGLVAATLGCATVAFLAFINTSVYGKNAASANNRDLDRALSALQVGKFLKLWSPAVIPEVRLATLAEMNQAAEEDYLRNRFQAHEDEITDVTLSPDGTLIASASKDRNVKIWDASGNLQAELLHLQGVTVVQFSADGQLALTGSQDGIMRLWNIADATIVKTFEGHSDSITDVQFSPDGTKLASGSADTTVRLWDFSGSSLAVLEQPETEVSGVQFSPDSQKLASFAEYDPVRVWNIENLDSIEEVSVLEETYRTIDVEFTENNQAITVLSRNASILTYSTSGAGLYGNAINTRYFRNTVANFSGSLNSPLLAYSDEKNEPNAIFLTLTNPLSVEPVLLNHEQQISTFDISFNEKFLVSASTDNQLYIWSLDSILNEVENHNWQTVFSDADQSTPFWSGFIHNLLVQQNSKGLTVKKNDNSHIAEILAQGSVFSFSPDEKIASVSNKNQSTFWTLDGQQIYLREDMGVDEYPVSASLIGNNREKIVSAHRNGTIKLWNLDGTLLNKVGNHEDVTGIISSQDVPIFISVSKELIQVWDTTGNLISRISVHDIEHLSSKQEYWNDAYLSPQGNFIAVIDNNGVPSLWKQDGTYIKELVGHSGLIRQIEFNPSEDKLMTSSYSRQLGYEVKTWQTDDGSPLKEFNQIGWSRFRLLSDGERLMSNNFRGISILELDGTEHAFFRGHVDGINDIRYVPETQELITAGEDNTLRLWDGKGKTIQIMRGHESPVVGVALSRDRTVMASVDSEGYVKLWKYGDSQSFTTLEKHRDFHSGHTNSIEFSPDGNTIVLLNEDRVTFLNKDGDVIHRLRGNNTSQSFNFFRARNRNHSNQLFLNRESTINLWDIEGNLIDSFDNHIDDIHSISFSPKGDRFASASTDQTVIIWHVNGDLIRELPHDDKVNSVSFSPDGQLLATASDDKKIRIWTLEGESSDNKPFEELDAHTDEVTSVLFDPTGQYLVSASTDDSIRFWDTKIWKEVEDLKFEIDVNNTELDALAFSKDGNMVTYGTNEVDVHLLNRRMFSGVWLKETAFYALKEIPPEGLPDQKHWVTVKGNKGVMVLSLGLDHSLQQVCKWAIDHLRPKPDAEDKGEHRLCNGILDD